METLNSCSVLAWDHLAILSANLPVFSMSTFLILTSELFREEIFRVLVRSRDHWHSTLSCARKSPTENNGRWLRNIADWLKLDFYVIGCELGRQEVRCFLRDQGSCVWYSARSCRWAMPRSLMQERNACPMFAGFQWPSNLDRFVISITINDLHNLIAIIN